MNRESFFWESMLKLSSQVKGQRPVTTNELNLIYTLLEDVRGFWEAGNFVKLCAHLKDHTVQEAAKAVIDLKNNNFMYEETIANETKRVTSSVSTRRSNGWGYSSYGSSFNHHSRRTDHVARYPEQRVGHGTEEMRAFLSQHFMHLSERQKQVLSDLRPWGKDRKSPSAP